MKTAKLTEIDAGSRKKVNRILADVRSMKATQVVLWYAVGGEETGVLISDGTDRVKAVGGLNSAAYDVWNRD
jgi:hypothetical protein